MCDVATYSTGFKLIIQQNLPHFDSLYFLDCGSDLARLKVSSYAYITPRVLNGKYYDNERCIFKFVASNGYRVKVIFDEFDTGKQVTFFMLNVISCFMHV